MFENKVLRRIFVTNKEEVIGLRKLHNEKHCTLYLNLQNSNTLKTYLHSDLF